MSFEGRVPAATATATARSARSAALLSAILLLAAIVQQCVIGLDADVSWLLTVGEKMLDGQRLYGDIFEVNPPASVWIYVPGIVAARAFATTPELATATLTFLLAALSFWMSARLLRGAGLLAPERSPACLAAAVFAFLLLPGACFAQREHIAVLTLLPFIALLAARLERQPFDSLAALLAGIGAGITIAIKPHFALAIAPMIVWLMWRRRSIAAGLGLECWTAAAVALAYVVAVAVLHPAFFGEALPLLRAVYLPSRNGFADVWLSPSALVFFVASALVLVLGRATARRNLAVLPLLAAIGFAAALAIQGKGYLNHWYPPVALALFAAVLALGQRSGDRTERVFSASVLLILAGSAAYVFAQAQSYPELAQLVRQVGPAQPRIIVAGSNLSVGHPLTRWVGGEWVGRRGALWATGTAVELMDSSSPEQRRVLQVYADEDRRIFVEDVETGRPDVILVPGEDGTRWITANPDVQRVASAYRSAGAAQGVVVMVRDTNTSRDNPE